MTVIKQCEKQLPLKCHSLLEKEVIFHEFDFETLEFEVLKSSIWKHTTCVSRVFFLSLLSCNFDDALSSNFHRFVILPICWHTLNEKTGLWQLSRVSTEWYVGIIQVRILIFDNYQMWTGSAFKVLSKVMYKNFNKELVECPLFKAIVNFR